MTSGGSTPLPAGTLALTLLQARGTKLLAATPTREPAITSRPARLATHALRLER